MLVVCAQEVVQRRKFIVGRALREANVAVP
jgi:hypothetical protein